MTDYVEIINKYPHDKSYLIEILREIQAEDGYVSTQAIGVISKELNILDVEIEGVVSFYSMLSHEQKGKNVIRVCKTACCKIAGADDIISILKKELKVEELGQITNDGKFSIEQCECIGMCDQAPAMLINEQPYGNLTAEKISEILKEYK